MNESYESIAPWDTSESQAEIRWLEEKGEIKSNVLDVGCGTGQNALFLADKGYNVTGIDISPNTIKIAKERARKRDLIVDFHVYDLFKLENHFKSYNTIIDSSIFHMFPNDKRKSYVKNIRSVLNDNGIYHMLVFSNKEPEGYGPRRIRIEEIKNTFNIGWNIYRIKEAKIDINILKGWSWAWLASLKKINKK